MLKLFFFLLGVSCISHAATSDYCSNKVLSKEPTAYDEISNDSGGTENACLTSCYSDDECEVAYYYNQFLGSKLCRRLRSYTTTATETNGDIFEFTPCCPALTATMAGQKLTASVYPSTGTCDLWQQAINGATCSYTCNDGFYMTGTAVLTCSKIPGTWSASAPSCTVCPADQYKDDGSNTRTSCDACPSNSVTIGGGETFHDEATDCKCIAGTIGSDGGPCALAGNHTYKDSIGNAAGSSCASGSIAFGTSVLDHDEASDCYAAAVTAISPTVGREGGGYSLTIYGSYFGPDVTDITVGGTPCTNVAYVGDAEYIGCYVDVPGDEDLTGPTSMTSGTLDVQECADYCTASFYEYFALTEGNECRCGNAYGKHGTASGCTTNCAGDASAKCGGSDRLSVYRRPGGDLTCTVPALAGGASYNVLVTVQGAATPPGPQLYIYADPVFVAMTPHSGFSTGGTEVTINITNLFSTPQLSCLFGAVDVSNIVPAVLSADNASVTCVTPAESIGALLTVDVAISITFDGAYYHPLGVNFAYTAPGKITAPYSFPSGAPAGEASDVYVFGNYYFDEPDADLVKCNLDGVLLDATYQGDAIVVCHVTNVFLAGLRPLKVTTNMQDWTTSYNFTIFAIATQLVMEGSFQDEYDNSGFLNEVRVMTLDDTGLPGDAATSYSVQATVVPVNATAPDALNVRNAFASTVSGVAVFRSLSFAGARHYHYRVRFALTGEGLGGTNYTLRPALSDPIRISGCSDTKVVDPAAPEKCICRKGYTLSSDGQSCSLCLPGSYKNTIGSAACTLCSEGQFASTAGSLACSECPPGSYTEEEGQSSCSLCAPGYFAPNNATSACQPASPGHYVGVNGATSQTQCPPGTFFGGTGAVVCTECPKGEFSSATGARNCSNCRPGYQAPATGMEACEACIPGTYARESRTAECLVCEDGKASDTDAAVECFSCPDNSLSSETHIRCECIEGFYKVEDECLACPNGAECKGYGAPPVTLPGFYQTGPATFVKCFPTEACTGGEMSACKTGYTGERCSDCVREPMEERHYHVGPACTPCDKVSNPWVSLVLFAFFVCLLVFVAAVMSTGEGSQTLVRTLPRSSFSIIVTTFQIISLFRKIDLSWPDNFLGAFAALGFFNLKISFVSPECSTPMPPPMRVLYAFLTPIVGIVITAFIFSFCWIFAKCYLRKTENVEGQSFKKYVARAAHPSVFLRAAMEFLHLAYMLEVETSLAIFTCFELADGRFVLEEFPNVVCHSEYWENNLKNMGIVGLSVYVVGLPVFLALLLLCFRNRLDDVRIKAWLGSLYEPYDRSIYWWILTEYTYKVMMGVCVAVIARNALTRTFSAFMVMVVALIANGAVFPFISMGDNLVQFGGLIITTYVLVLGLFFHAFPGEDGQSTVSTVGIAFLAIMTLAMMAVAFYTAKETVMERYYIWKAGGSFRDMLAGDPTINKNNYHTRFAGKVDPALVYAESDSYVTYSSEEEDMHTDAELLAACDFDAVVTVYADVLAKDASRNLSLDEARTIAERVVKNSKRNDSLVKTLPAGTVSKAYEITVARQAMDKSSSFGLDDCDNSPTRPLLPVTVATVQPDGGTLRMSRPDILSRSHPEMSNSSPSRNPTLSAPNLSSSQLPDLDGSTRLPPLSNKRIKTPPDIPSQFSKSFDADPEKWLQLNALQSSIDDDAFFKTDGDPGDDPGASSSASDPVLD